MVRRKWIEWSSKEQNLKPGKKIYEFWKFRFLEKFICPCIGVCDVENVGYLSRDGIDFVLPCFHFYIFRVIWCTDEGTVLVGDPDIIYGGTIPSTCRRFRQNVALVLSIMTGRTQAYPYRVSCIWLWKKLNL